MSIGHPIAWSEWIDEPTLQFLHFHTKLASPRLPLCSFISYAIVLRTMKDGAHFMGCPNQRALHVGTMTHEEANLFQRKINHSSTRDSHDG